MIIGTAGHIDHGKTTLVKALTGVDADRLPEEKARGITLDLGYAYTPLASGEVLGFIDVPGHEKLIHNMLAGATGIDFVLVVVAADDGPMPQTREHLEIVDLLGLTGGAVALTKCDAVGAERRQAAEAEVRAMLADTSLAGAPVFPISAVTGEGVSALRACLEAAAAEVIPRGESGGLRLAVDRSFSLSGIGTVLTGTVFSGRVCVGDEVAIGPNDLRARVRSLHVQDRPAQEGSVGQRCALNLVGDFERSDIARGMWVLAPALNRPTARFSAWLRVPRDGVALAHGTGVHVYQGAADILGRVMLLEGDSLPAGGEALAEILLDKPTCAALGDRLILRDASARHTVAGGRVLDVSPPVRHKRAPARLAFLRALAAGDVAGALMLAAESQPAGVDLSRFALNANLASDAAGELWRNAGLRVIEGEPTLGFTGERWATLAARLLEALAEEHQRAPDMVGVERDRLRRLTLPSLPRSAFDQLLAPLVADGRIAATGAWLHLPGHRVQISPVDADLWRVLKRALMAAPYGPPRVRDVATAAGIAEETVRSLFKRVARAGELHPVAHDHYFTAAAVGDLAAMVRDLCAAHGAARAAELRDRIGGGRKVAIHILEFFDRVGYTRRVRDEHVLRGEATRTWEL